MEKRLRKGILRSREKKIFYLGRGVKINRTDNIDILSGKATIEIPSDCVYASICQKASDTWKR